MTSIKPEEIVFPIEKINAEFTVHGIYSFP